MSRCPAKFTQADVARAIRAAKQEGAPGIDVLLSPPDGERPVDQRNEIVL